MCRKSFVRKSLPLLTQIHVVKKSPELLVDMGSVGRVADIVVLGSAKTDLRERAEHTLLRSYWLILEAFNAGAVLVVCFTCSVKYRA